MEKKVAVERYGAKEPKQTTHVAVVDYDGNCVTMTHSLGMPSGVITDNLGFMYNGCMAVFDPRPNRAGSIAPARADLLHSHRQLSQKKGALHSTRSSGRTQIAMGILQAVANVIDFDMTMLEAVSAPRFSATSNLIDVMNRIPSYVTNNLEGQGYKIARSALSLVSQLSRN